MVDEEATAQNQAEADKQAAEEGNEGGADKMTPGQSGLEGPGLAACWAGRRAGLAVVQGWATCSAGAPTGRPVLLVLTVPPVLPPPPPVLPAVMKTEYVEEQAWAVQNDNKPLWVRSPKEVQRGEYDAFFKATFR